MTLFLTFIGSFFSQAQGQWFSTCCNILPELADIVVGLVDGELAGADRVEGGGVTRVLEVGAVVTRRLTARLGN